MQAMDKAMDLCQKGRIRVYYFSKKGPLEEKDPERMLGYMFTAAFMESSNELEFKKPLQLDVGTDFKPLLERLTAGTKIGVQIGNPPLAIASEIKRYAPVYETINKKRKTGLQLSEHERGIAGVFENYSVQGPVRLRYALYCQQVLNAMASAGLSLAVMAGKMGIRPVVSICPDDGFATGPQEIIASHFAKRLAAYSEIIKRISGVEPQTMAYPQSELACKTQPCDCVFCDGRRCPGQASAAVQRLVDAGCSTVVNFYLENDGIRTGSFMHFERIERGMLHRTTQHDGTKRCNVYFGVNRGFMVIHEPYSEVGI